MRTRASTSALAALGACGAVGGIAVWYGCSIYDPSLLAPAPLDGGDDVSEASTADGLTDAGPDASACGLAHAPPPPAADDPSDAGEIETWGAIRFIDLGLPDDAGVSSLLGYDLDGVYTCCHGGPESCGARSPNATHCDLEGGRDNALVGLVQKLTGLGGKSFDLSTINQRIASGSYTLIVRLRKYNGQANDTQVELAMFVSDGIAAPPDASAPPPAWDGTDVWTLDSESVLLAPDGGDVVPNYVDDKAYVNNHLLVASLDFPIQVGGGGAGFTIELTGTVVTATLKNGPNGGYATDDGQFAGRWATPKLLQALGGIKVPNVGYICPGTPFYESAKSNYICPAVDIALAKTDDLQGKPCSALSVGFGYRMAPAQPGPVVTKTPAPPTCPDASGAPDDCQ